MSVTLNILWKKTDSIALALSGGIDSMVLYHLLNTKYRDTYKNLTIFHVNHGVREVSDEEERILKKLANENKHLFISTKLTIDGFTQQKGRNARYAFFNDMIKKHNIDYCLTAHHSDDNVETILHELLTNRYLYGVGIPLAEGKFLRPMMALTKKEIVNYGKVHNVFYLRDVSNDSDAYTRNYLRHQVVPVIDCHEHLHSNALLFFQNDYNEIVEVIKRKAQDFIGINKKHNRDLFNSLEHITKVYVLSALFKDYIERSYLEECIRVLDSSVAQSVVTSNNHALHISYDIFFIDKEKNEDELTDTYLEIFSPGFYQFNGYTIEVFSLNEPLFVRTRQPGDCIQIPNVGTKQLRRLFIDKKVPNAKRNEMPIITKMNGQIIAVGPIYNIMKSANEAECNIRLEIKEYTHDT